MSASQTPSPGRTPNGLAVPNIKRRRPASNPLVRPRKPNQARPLNGGLMPNGISTTKGQLASSSLQSKPLQPLASVDQGPYEDIPVFTTKRALLGGFRHHVMRFIPNVSASVANVNPADESQFTRPVRLHRRDPRATPATQWGIEGSFGGSNSSTKSNLIDDKERERLEIQKAQKQAEREANQAQIAPVNKPNAPAKKNQFQKKTEQVYQASDSSGKKQDLQLRYEESLPWHLEDDDNKSTWMGTYEAALSNCHVMFMPESQGGTTTKFRMVPLEKWYKFTARNQFKALSIEEAEARMGKKVKDPRWFMETQRQAMLERKTEADRRAGGGLFTRKGERGEKSFKTEDDDQPEEAIDADDIDYNYEEAFADDEENALFGGDDEEVKEAENKIKKEQREANVFELKEDKDFDQEEQEEQRKAEEQKKMSKKTQKALMRREKNYVYEDDSEGNPYSSESESEDSEAERLKEEERVKAEEQSKPVDSEKNASSEKLPSGASSKGNNTPSGRPKHVDLKKTLKRPGSPNLSEASGSESTRKKVKSKHGPSQQSSDTGRNTPISRPASPSNSQNDTSSAQQGDRRSPSLKSNVDSSSKGSKPRKISVRPYKAGSGSEAEKSDASKRIKKSHMQDSRSASPNGSRAGSPSVVSGTSTPAPTASSKINNASSSGHLPSAEEIRALVPPEGIALNDVIKIFKNAVRNPGFIPLVKANSRWHKETKTLFPKDSRAGVTAGQGSVSTPKNDANGTINS